jgi:arylsulfatase
MTDAPNILLITTDQHRFDALGCMGNREVPTPNIDRLAGQGVLFERCYVTNPVCMPCRASFMTGQFPDAHGVRRNGIPVPDVPYSLARTLRGQDLRTGVIGKTHFASLRRSTSSRNGVAAPTTSASASGRSPSGASPDFT